jgi:hypothetical protein
VEFYYLLAYNKVAFGFYFLLGDGNMSRGRRSRWFCSRNLIPIILASIGLGMLIVVIVPFWLWVLGLGAGLIIFAWLSYWDK